MSLYIPFKNSYANLPEAFWEKNRPQGFKKPELIIFNHELALELGIKTDGCSSNDLASVFSGSSIPEGAEPLSQAYAAYQFGHMVPQLGDGRAHLLGEVNGFDIQLKGSGRSRFSRRGDGLSSLGPVIREYIVSEAMHALGVPTTRSLAAVRTGEDVVRDYHEAGGVFTRVASSHIRVGTFQYFYFREDWGSLETLLNYTIERHYPELSKFESLADKSMGLIKALIEKQSDLISDWMSLGFIHGVMNTDNFSMAGITIDFGPCAFMDEFKMNKVFSSIDRQGRYAYSNQIGIAQWNILRLADCLLYFIDEDFNKAAKKVETEILELMPIFETKTAIKMARKFGLEDYKKDDDHIVQKFLEYMEEEGLDFTLSFRNLPELYNGEDKGFPKTEKREEFIKLWKARNPKVEGLDKINPLYIPRNHQVERAIQAGFNGDYSVMKELIEVLKKPFEEHDSLNSYSVAPRPEERVVKTFCGT